MITYHLESFAQLMSDGADVMLENYKEFGLDGIAPQPDVPKYILLDTHGRLLVLTAREEKKIVGYQIVVLTPHPHDHQVLCGMVDAHFLSKSHRKGMTGLRLIKETLSVLRQLGVQLVVYNTKNQFQKVFEKLGFEQTAVVMTRWL
jgi:hypothetical protein